MQLYDFLQDENLNSIREEMKAPLIDASELPYRPGLTYADVFEIFDEPESNFEEIEVKQNGLLYYKGVLISLNIKDVNQTTGEENLPKLHISFCKALHNMKAAGRFKRYITSCKTTSFRKIRFVSESYVNSLKIVDCKLDVCKYCLEKIQWKQYTKTMSHEEKQFIVENFDLKEFYQTFEPQFYTDFKGILYKEEDRSPVNIYQKDWGYISYRYRKSKNWHCELCKKSFEKNKAYLHVHHINGIKSDNNLANLRALCYVCHSKQPHHEHMQIS
ncbi:HNH endonuclease [Acinetobacter sp. YH01003]|uniref:HNH endonuclease signature motif containing protein n=1 Tax=Acinetobacter sp. YH01003 TaxID=2601019 RepID=UPI0015D0EAA5|nr:HNH endonuclease [Acinetobacter sp. YH01003]